MRLTGEQIGAARARLIALAETPVQPVDFSIQEAVDVLLDNLVAVGDAGHTLAAALAALNGDQLTVTLSTLKSAKKRALELRRAGADASSAVTGPPRGARRGERAKSCLGKPPRGSASTAGATEVGRTADQTPTAGRDGPETMLARGAVEAAELQTSPETAGSGGTGDARDAQLPQTAALASVEAPADLSEASASPTALPPPGRMAGGFRPRRSA